MAVTEPKHGEAAAALLVALIDGGARPDREVAAWTRQLLQRFPDDTGQHVLRSMIELAVFTVGTLEELEPSGAWKDVIRLAAWDLAMQRDGEDSP